nr:reverse transcriptase domain-containing protein [Tanacetum cinerariifolium]
VPHVEVAASNQARKKTLLAWKQQKTEQIFFDKRGDFRNQQRSERRRNRFTLLTKSPKGILDLGKGKFKAPPPMSTPVEKRNNNKFCEFHGEVEHNNDECMHLKRQIKELIKAVKLSHVIKVLKQGSGKDQPKAAKKGEASRKGKDMAQSGGEKSNGSSHRTPHWLQRRNHMANRTNITIDENSPMRNSHTTKPKLIPLECTMVSEPKVQHSASNRVVQERIKVAIHPEYPEQTIAIGSTLGGGSATCSKTPAEHSRRMSPSQTEEKKPSTIKKQGNTRGSRKTCGSRHHEGSLLSQLAVKLSNDAYKGYHQIKMAKEDKEKIAFITSQGIFCYLKMPFGLKNAGATYQRLVDKAFQKQIDINLEVYVDDLVIKSRTEQEIIRGIKETFKTLRKLTMKLNPKKCTFGVEEGMFLGYMVNTKGIKVYFIVKPPEDDSLAAPMEVEEEHPKPWTLFTDGSSCIDAEYEALIAGLIIAEQMGIKNLQTNVDSRLVANQVNRSYIAKEPSMIQYLEKLKTLTNSFKKFSIKQVPRSENKKADALKVLTVMEEEGNTWMTPIYEYLMEEILHAEKKKARAVQLKSRQYFVIIEVLYKKSFLEQWLRYVRPLLANYVLREIHEGSCSMHA